MSYRYVKQVLIPEYYYMKAYQWRIKRGAVQGVSTLRLKIKTGLDPRLFAEMISLLTAVPVFLHFVLSH